MIINMFTLLQRVVFGFLLFAVIIRSHRKIRKDKFTPLKGDAKRCLQNPQNCIDVKHYPIEHIRNLAANNKLFKETFNVDKVPFGDWNEGESRDFCKTKQILAFPKIGSSVHFGSADRQYIIQLDDEGYKQGIIVNLCLPSDTGHQCDAMQQHMNGNTTCVQKYGSKFLWAIYPCTGEPKMREFQFPIACICQYHIHGGN